MCGPDHYCRRRVQIHHRVGVDATDSDIGAKSHEDARARFEWDTPGPANELSKTLCQCRSVSVEMSTDLVFDI
jgi:hypothetical protein